MKTNFFSLVRYFLGATFLILNAAQALEVGESFPTVSLQNQFNENITVDKQTKYILFSADKAASTLLHENLTSTKTKPEDVGAVYISDISKMPSLITKMVALPKMKKYDYKLGLDRDGVLTKPWPRKDGEITCIELKDSKIVSITYLKTNSEIQNFLKKPEATTSVTQ